jgi:hypothetical protein
LGREKGERRLGLGVCFRARWVWAWVVVCGHQVPATQERDKMNEKKRGVKLLHANMHPNFR